MDERYKVVEIFVALLGLFIPILMWLANRALKDRDEKMRKLFSLCDEQRDCNLKKAIKIAKLEEKIDQLERIAERCNK
jgi:hypothetical protein